MASTAENSEEVFALPILKLICNATTSEITKVSVILKMPRYPLILRSPFNGGVYADSFLPGILTLLPEIVLQIWLIVWISLLYVLGFIF